MNSYKPARVLRSHEELDRIVFYAVHIASTKQNDDPNNVWANDDNLAAITSFIAVAVRYAIGNMRTTFRQVFGCDCPLLYADDKSAWENARTLIVLLNKKLSEDGKL